MNEKNLTNRGGHESQSPDNADPSAYNEGSLWNNPIGRRVFLKKTGAATVATAVALHGFRVQVQAQQSPPPNVINAKRTIRVHRGTFTWISYSNSSEQAAVVKATNGIEVEDVKEVPGFNLNLLASRFTIVQNGTVPSTNKPNPEVKVKPIGEGLQILAQGVSESVDGVPTKWFCKVQASAYRKTTTYHCDGGNFEINDPNYNPNNTEAEVTDAFDNGTDYDPNA